MIPVSMASWRKWIESAVVQHDTDISRLFQSLIPSTLSDGQAVGNYPGAVYSDPNVLSEFYSSGGGGGGGSIPQAITTSALTSSASDIWGAPNYVMATKKIRDPSATPAPGTFWPLISSSDPDIKIWVTSKISSIPTGTNVYYCEDTMPDGSTQCRWLGGDC